MHLKPRIETSSDNNIFWITMTDLMTGLVLVFMVLFFYTYLVNNIEKLNQNIAKENVSKNLQQVFDNKSIDASIDPVSGIVKISNLELFEVNSSTLSTKGKKYLDTFTPAYFDSIFSNDYLKKNLEKIIIQGHTDSQTFQGDFSENSQYMKNMELSLKRAYAVADYMTKTPYNQANGDKIRKMIVVEGVSFSNPVIVNGKEDFAKSRRVELKLVMKKEK